MREEAVGFHALDQVPELLGAEHLASEARVPGMVGKLHGVHGVHLDAQELEGKHSGIISHTS